MRHFICKPNKKNFKY